jgi:glutamyl/glutaminyl-tRNA synthetase
MRQLLVYEALVFGTPTFAHVSLIVDKDRSKLSKRRGATSVAEFRELGYLPGALLNCLALLGWSASDGRELLTRDELVREFDLGRVSASPAAFDEGKLDWVNAHHIREEPLEQVAALARPFAEEAGIVEPDAERFERMVALVREGVARLSDTPAALSIFFGERVEMEDVARAHLADDGAKAVVRRVRERVAEREGTTEPGTFKVVLRSVGEELGVKGKDLFMPVRAAVTGRTHGPALADVVDLLGRDVVMARLADAAE